MISISGVISVISVTFTGRRHSGGGYDDTIKQPAHKGKGKEHDHKARTERHDNTTTA